jgi:CxxC motif-containing protein (DUF1111 family)
MRRAIFLLLFMGLGCEEPESTSAVEPGEALPGGATTNTLLLGRNAFLRPIETLDPIREAAFFAGNSLFNQAWVQAPSSTTRRDGLGPLFNARSCAGCHLRDGRGRPPDPDAPDALGLLVRLSRPDGTPDPVYGGQLQPFALPEVPAEGRVRIETTVISGMYGDGTPYERLMPTYHLEAPGYGPFDPDLRLSPRVAPAMIGLGLLEAIPQASLEALADPDDADQDGISGRPSRVIDPETGEETLGRFGWRAEQATVRSQAAAAFRGDLGITTPVFPEHACTPTQAECQASEPGGAPEIEVVDFDKVVLYSQTLAVPVRRGHDQPYVLRGKEVFAQLGCQDCHTPSHLTGPAALPELEGHLIWPYTDLLLHDLGPELADAVSAEWRTPPLWGLGLLPAVNGHQRLLHDGRARGFAEAILWHGGEALASREAFRTASAGARADLIHFLESL